MSRVRRYSRSGPTAAHLRSPTGLSPPAVTRSSGLRLTGVPAARRLPPPPAHSFNPPQASPAGYAARGVWAPPRSLAATKGILSVPRGTEMFQFPRCPLRDRSQSARPCAGRVAPFGDPRIAGCQRLPGAFRRVAASFLGRQRQGIHHAPIMRIPASSSLRGLSWPRQQTGARQRDGPVCRSASPLPRLRGTSLETVCGSCVCVCCSSVRAGDQTRAPASHRSRCDVRLGSRHTPSRADIVPRPQNPAGPAWRIVKVQDPKVVRPVGRETHRSSRSSNLVRSRSPTSHEASQPAAGGLVTAAGMLAQRRASSAPGWSRGDSNPGPPPCKGGALPAKLRPPGSSASAASPPRQGGRAWTRTRDLGLIRAAL